MTRDIKFKAYIRSLDEIVDVQQIHYGYELTDGVLKDNVQYIVYHNYCYYPDDFELLQYTELDDEKGEEIYDGAILEDVVKGYIGEVFYDRGRFVVGRPIEGASYTCDWDLFAWYYTFKVIGNIHDAKHLPKRAKKQLGLI